MGVDGCVGASACEMWSRGAEYQSWMEWVCWVEETGPWLRGLGDCWGWGLSPSLGCRIRAVDLTGAFRVRLQVADRAGRGRATLPGSFGLVSWL